MSLFNLFCHGSSNRSKKRDYGEIKGRKYETKVAKKLTKNGIQVTGRGIKLYDKFGKPITDIDIQTKHANIETKTGSVKTHIGRQLKKYRAYDSTKEAIGMAPNLSENERENLNRQGYNVFSHEKNLVLYLKYKEKNPEKTEIRPDPKNRSFQKNLKRKR